MTNATVILTVTQEADKFFSERRKKNGSRNYFTDYRLCVWWSDFFGWHRFFFWEGPSKNETVSIDTEGRKKVGGKEALLLVTHTQVLPPGEAGLFNGV